MAKQTVVTRTEREIEDQQNGNPIAVAIKSFLMDGLDIPETLLNQYELTVKVQRLDRTGRPLHGLSHRSQNIPTVFDELLDQFGPGRYNFFVQYKKTGQPGDPSVVVVKDLRVADPEQVPGLQEVPVTANPPDTRNDAMMEVLKSIMLQNTQIITAALAKQGGDGGKAIGDAIRTGIELALDAQGPGTEHEENPNDDEEEPSDIDRILDIAAPLIKKLMESGDDSTAITRGDIRKEIEQHTTPAPAQPGAQPPEA